MEKKEKNGVLSIMYRRWIYMIIAIAAAAFLQSRPVLNFNEDKGIIYIRSFSMDEKTFYVTQTSLSDNVPEITATMSVAGLYWCNKAMLWGAILCLLCFFSNRWRIRIATVTAIIAGLYYVLLVYYAMKMSDDHYATLYPNWMVIWPAIVCQMMVLTSRNVIKQIHDQADEAMEQQPNEKE
jgi:branched-subunit amino acid transport protein AzlD